MANGRLTVGEQQHALRAIATELAPTGGQMGMAGLFATRFLAGHTQGQKLFA